MATPGRDLWEGCSREVVLQVADLLHGLRGTFRIREWRDMGGLPLSFRKASMIQMRRPEAEDSVIKVCCTANDCCHPCLQFKLYCQCSHGCFHPRNTGPSFFARYISWHCKCSPRMLVDQRAYKKPRRCPQRYSCVPVYCFGLQRVFGLAIESGSMSRSG